MPKKIDQDFERFEALRSLLEESHLAIIEAYVGLELTERRLPRLSKLLDGPQDREPVIRLSHAIGTLIERNALLKTDLEREKHNRRVFLSAYKAIRQEYHV